MKLLTSVLAIDLVEDAYDEEIPQENHSTEDVVEKMPQSYDRSPQDQKEKHIDHEQHRHGHDEGTPVDELQKQIHDTRLR